MTNNIAIIPARGGSKRIPRKNIKLFFGEPMITRTIKTLIDCEIFDTILVSTDDKEIAEIALQSGAKVPFLRDAALSDDVAPTAPVISDALKRYEGQSSITYNNCCCVYPCNPILKIENILKAHSMLVERRTYFVYPVCEYPHPIQRSLILDSENKPRFRHPEHELAPTQSLDKFYHDAGQFYWGTRDAWISGRKMHTDGLAMPIPSWQVVDIDTNEDWHRAELIFRMLQNDGENLDEKCKN